LQPAPETKGTGLAQLTSLMEAALTRENLKWAFKRVRAEKGAAGVDGLDIDRTARLLLTRGGRGPGEDFLTGSITTS